MVQGPAVVLKLERARALIEPIAVAVTRTAIPITTLGLELIQVTAATVAVVVAVEGQNGLVLRSCSCR